MKRKAVNYLRLPGYTTSAGARVAPREVLHVLHIPGWILRLFGVRRHLVRYERDCPGAWCNGQQQVGPVGQRRLFDMRDKWEHDHELIADRPPVRQEQLSGPGPRVMPSGPAYAPGELFECDCGHQHPAGWVCNSAHRDRV